MEPFGARGVQTAGRRNGIRCRFDRRVVLFISDASLFTGRDNGRTQQKGRSTRED